MNRFLNSKVVSVLCATVILAGNVIAGNADRAGQAGAQELLINPWARSSGWAGANVANSKGLESMFTNIAGTAFTKKTELIFSHTALMPGANIGVNAFGLTQRVGETGAIGLSFTSMSFGNIGITTVDLPDGTIGTYSPSFVNMTLSYAKGFSDNIYGGVAVKYIKEGLPDVNAQGVALDAGIQYVTGAYENIHFGVALKNIGPTMSYTGDGLSFRTPTPQNNPTGNTKYTVENRSADFELPSLINIGAAYDYYFSKDSMTMKNNRLTAAANFTSNSFSKDLVLIGLEYSWKTFLMARVGYQFESSGTSLYANNNLSTSMYTGLSCGMTVEIPFTKSKSTFALDYSYRDVTPFQGVHTIGARINL